MANYRKLTLMIGVDGQYNAQTVLDKDFKERVRNYELLGKRVVARYDGAVVYLTTQMAKELGYE